MDMLYEFIVDIMTKRIVIETPNVKVDQIIDKLVLIDIPQGVDYFDWTEEFEQVEGEEPKEPIEHKRNTDEKAVILIKVPQIEEEEEVKLEVTDGDGQEKTEIIRRLVDEDQKESAISLQGRDVAGINKTVDARQFYVMNLFAAKSFREDFLAFVMKTYPEFFDDNNDYDEILSGSHD